MKIQVLLLLLIACVTAESFGHNIQIFAGNEGTEISGYVYFSDGGRVRDANVKVFTNEGELILQTRTNQEGVFRFTANQGMDLTVVADTKDGHRAEWSVRANEIPESLPDPTVWKEGHSDPTLANGKNGNLELRRMIREELRPLEAQFTRRNEEFERFRNEIRWRDIVGGIGYLIGIAGVACCLRGRRQRSQE